MSFRTMKILQTRPPPWRTSGNLERLNPVPLNPRRLYKSSQALHRLSNLLKSVLPLVAHLAVGAQLQTLRWYESPPSADEFYSHGVTEKTMKTSSFASGAQPPNEKTEHLTMSALST